MSLWNAVCSVLLCSSVRKRTIARLAGEFFSHRTHRFNRTHLRTVSNPQKAFGIQTSQSVKTIVDTDKGQHKADILLIGVSRWSLPFPPGEGSGEGPLSLWAFVCSVLLCFSVRNRTHPLDEMIYMQIFGEFYLSQSTQSSLSIFAHSFEPTERLRHTEFTEAFQLTLAVTLCDIGWLNVSVECCVFCSSVFFCEK